MHPLPRLKLHDDLAYIHREQLWLQRRVNDQVSDELSTTPLHQP